MKHLSLKIPLIYLVLSSIYYALAYLLGQVQVDESGSLAVQFFNELDQLLYWGNIHVIYIFSMMGTSLIGLFWFYRKSMMEYSRGFAYVLIFSVFSFLTLLILVSFQ